MLSMPAARAHAAAAGDKIEAELPLQSKLSAQHHRSSSVRSVAGEGGVGVCGGLGGAERWSFPKRKDMRCGGLELKFGLDCEGRGGRSCASVCCVSLWFCRSTRRRLKKKIDRCLRSFGSSSASFGGSGCILSEQRIGNVIQMVRGASGSSPKRLQKKGT